MNSFRYAPQGREQVENGDQRTRMYAAARRLNTTPTKMEINQSLPFMGLPFSRLSRVVNGGEFVSGQAVDAAAPVLLFGLEDQVLGGFDVLGQVGRDHRRDAKGGRDAVGL